MRRSTTSFLSPREFDHPDSSASLPRLPGGDLRGDVVRRWLRRRVVTPLDTYVFSAVRRVRNRERLFRPVFIAGAMGSGTTLVSNSLAQRFDCAGLVAESAADIHPGSFLHVPMLKWFSSVRAYEQAILPMSTWSLDRGREDLLRLYRSRAWGPADAVIDKGPNTNLVRAAFLARCFPDAFFIFVFRDPVANIEGFRRKWPTFAADSLDECMRFYLAIHQRFLEEMEPFRERVYTIEYESFVRRPEAVLDALAARIGLTQRQRPMRLPYRPNVPGKGIRNVRGTRIVVVQDATEQAYRSVSSEFVARIRARLGSLHERLRTSSA